MKIKIQRLELTNFKCFRHKEITFDSDVTTIRGRNGVGKTTIADAILWTLFCKNTAGQADFDLKTHDSDGKPIPNLDHSVELTLTVFDGSPVEKTITLRRTLKETWIKKRGSEEMVFKNNTTEYLVNGDSYTAGDYKKYIAQLVDEDVFKAITSPTYFTSLKWQVQREFLTKMVGDISPEEVCGTNDELFKVFGSLAEGGDDIISYRKHLSYQIKQIKDKLDKIPIRLEEQNKALPESLDYEAIQMEYDNAKRELEAIDDKIVAIKSGNGGDVLRNQIRSELKELQASIDKIDDVERKEYRLRQQKHDDNVSLLSLKFNQLVAEQRDFEQTIQSFDKMVERCKETLDQCEKDAQAIREEWSHNISRTFYFHDADGICPTCGQYLPEDQVAEKRKKAEENLNADKARIKAELTEKANKVKATRADAEQQIKDIEAMKSEAENNLSETKEEINRIFSEKQKAEKEPVVSYEEAVACNAEYQQLLVSLEETQKKLDSVGMEEGATEKLGELQCQLDAQDTIMRNATAKLATRDLRLRILALIDGINEEQKGLVRQLSELERKEDVARRYQDRQNAILEERINEHFSLVKWKMFRTVNNGGDPFDEPFCECYVNGVAYHDGLNQAARNNAGLDIINTLCKHYNVSAPIVLDNAESTIDILQTIGQQIRLEVADTDLQVL